MNAVLAVLLALALGVSDPDAERNDVRFLQGLRERQLFELAEAYCLERLQDQKLSAAHQVELVLELIRTYSAHAVSLPPEQRQEWWDKGRQVVSDFERQHASHARMLLVRVQGALSDLALAELSRQEAEVGADSAQRLRAASELARGVAQRLQALHEEIAVAQRRADRDNRPGALSDEQWSALQNNLSLQQARAFRNLALCFPPQSDDRVAGLTRATQALAHPLSQLAADDPLLAQVHLERARCNRLLLNPTNARQSLAAIAGATLPAAIKQLALAEQIHLELSQNQLARALQWAAQRPTDTPVQPELDYAILSAQIRAWSQSTSARQPNADALRNQTLAQVRLIERLHGPYWGRRAEQLLVGAASVAGDSESTEILSRTADDLYRKQRYRDALVAYQRAGQAALRNRNDNLAFDLYTKAALVLRQLEQFAEASNVWEFLAQRLPTHPRAPQVHLMAILDTATAARSDDQLLPKYRDRLLEHLKRWPQSSTADQVRVWFGQLEESQQQFESALGSFQTVSAASPHLAEAVAGCRRIVLMRLQDEARPPQELQQLAEQSVAYFEGLIVDSNGQPPQAWDVARLNALEAACRIRVSFLGGGYQRVQALIEAALPHENQMDKPWQADIRMLLVIALAAQPGGQTQASRVLREMDLGGSSVETPLRISSQLAAIRKGARREMQAPIAAVELEALQHLATRTSEMSASERSQFERMRASALSANGQLPLAIQQVSALAAANPRDGALQEEYAALLSQSSAPEHRAAALKQWRLVARGRKPHTEAWYRAKYHVAAAQLQLGEKQQAAQLIRYLQVTPPGLGKTSWKGRFEQLLQACES